MGSAKAMGTRFQKINFSLSSDEAPGGQARLKTLTRDIGGGGLSGLSPQSFEDRTTRRPPSAETAGRLYLQTYLEDAQNEGLAAVASPDRPELVPDLRLLSSTLAAPLAARSMVFEQTWKGISVFGGRVAVDVDEGDRSLVSINGQLAPPPDIAPFAEISSKQAAEKAGSWSSHGDVPDDAKAVLTWFLTDIGVWHLCWHFSSVPLAPPSASDGLEPDDHRRFCCGPSPRSRLGIIDLLVDAKSGEVVFFYPSTPALNVPIPMDGDDVDGILRVFYGLQTQTGFALSDPLRNIVTYDYNFQDIDQTPLPPLPRLPITHPAHNLGSGFGAAVSAHHHATQVFDFFNDILKRDGVDDQGMQLVSVVNVWSSAHGSPPPLWPNAVWWQKRMWYGATSKGSLAGCLDVIAHELTHGVTESSSNLVYRDLPGALNESYSDIFGVIIANWFPNEPEPIQHWNWQIGNGIGASGAALRDVSNPAAAGQPDHFSRYVKLPYGNDYGGVHLYSGIHNKAIFHLLTDTDARGNATFPIRDAALLLYLTLTRLTQTSDFHDSRRTLESVTRAYYGGDAAVRSVRLNAIATAFGKVGL
jgi:Zn-dependent metalloprotease